jgi:hypothetical protein
MRHQAVAQVLLHVTCSVPNPWHAVNGIAREVKAVQPVQHCHVEWRRCRSLFLVAVHMKVVMVGALVRQAMTDQIGFVSP